MQLMGDEFKNPMKAQQLLKDNIEEIEKSLAYFYQMSTFKQNLYLNKMRIDQFHI